MRARPSWNAWAGLIAIAAALGGQWLLHTIEPQLPFAPDSAAQWIVFHTPGGFATEAIDRLGYWALRIVRIFAILAAIGLGAAVGRWRPVAVGPAVAAASMVSAAVDPAGAAPFSAAVSAVVAGCCALAATTLLSKRGACGRPTDSTRRAVLVLLSGGAAAVILGGTALRRALTAALSGPVRADKRATIPTDRNFATVDGLTSAVTSPEDHYVVDINVDPPAIAGESWQLTVGGAVHRTLSLSLDDLRAMTTVEQLTMLSCISNKVGGPLTGNALWTGVRLSDVLDRAGTSPKARAVRVSAADGYVEVIPIERARRPEVLVAIAMDGVLLPREHGFPARLLVPGLYGMKNVKWLTELAVLEREEEGYWEQRGWDLVAEARTESRFDTPQDHDDVDPAFTAAGLAWAGDRRISRVEVSVDDGSTWLPAQLEEELGPFSWRRWQVRLRLEPGVHALMVRAYDGAGRVQDAERRPPHPSGASGYHRITVTVRRR